jgi:hypothetical protein
MLEQVFYRATFSDLMVAIIEFSVKHAIIEVSVTGTDMVTLPWQAIIHYSDVEPSKKVE